MTWIDAYNQLVVFYKQNGHTKVKLSDNKQLYIWISCIRMKYKHGQLSTKQIEELNAIDFQWSIINKERSTWEDNFQYLKTFLHSNPIKNLRTQNPTLYSWLSRQRREINKLPKNKKDRLIKIGINLGSISHKEAWEEKYSKLKKEISKLQKQNANRQILIRDLSPSIRRWVMLQKKLALNPLFDPKRKEKLAKLGFIKPHVSYEQKWDTQYNEYKELLTINIQTKISARLVRWCAEQRRKYKNGLLSQERIQKLEEINFNWKIK